MLILAALVLVLHAGQDARPIAGVVLDASGAPVAGARIAQANGRRIVATSAEDGTFTVALPVDPPVTLVISADGFADETVRVARDGAVPLRIQLLPRGLAETVTVSANPDALRVMTPVSATVLDGAALAASPSQALDDRLRSVPGFSLFRRSSSRVANPTTQGVTLRGLSASGASRTAVLADGVPLNDPFGGWVYWDRVPAAAIDRVAVVRGGASDLHGSDALGGAIRITTSSATAARVWLDGGSHGSARASVYGGRRFTRAAVIGALETATTDGFEIVAAGERGPIDVPAFSEYATGYAGLSTTVGAGIDLGVRGGYFTEDRGNGTPFQTNATIIRQVSANAAGGAWGGAWAAHAFGASQDYDQTFSAVAADRVTERPTTLQHVDVESAGAGIEWVRGSSRTASVVSALLRQTSADLIETPATGPVPPTLTAARQRTAAVAVQSSWYPSGRLTVGLGARVEAWQSGLRGGESRTTWNVLPRASVGWRVNETVSLRGAVHRAYRTPTINELYRPFRVGNVLTRANDALSAEDSTGLEAALLARRGLAAVRVAAFWTRLSDAIVNVTLQSTPSAIIRQRQNASRIRAAGIELEADARLTPVVSLTASAAFIDSIFTTGAGLEGLRVPQVPTWQASVGALGRWDRATASFEWRFVSEQFDDDRNQFELDSSSMVNGRAAWTVLRSLELFAAIENAFDRVQEVGKTPITTTGLPRSMRVGMRWAR